MVRLRFHLLTFLLLAGGVNAAPPLDRPYLVVVGTAQDGGLPHAACVCVRCEAARSDERRRRYVASIALVLPATDDKPQPPRVLLVDATPDLREQLDLLLDVRHGPPGGTDRHPVDGVLLTHAHIGHYLGLAFFGFEAVHTRGLPVYCTDRMAEFLRGNGPWSQLVRLGNIKINAFKPGDALAIDARVRLTSLRVPHREEYSDTVGFLFTGSKSSVLYVPDTEPWAKWKPSLLTVLDGVDVLLVDGTFYSSAELPGRAVSSIGHPLITDTMDLLQDRVSAGKLKVYFTHLNHSNPVLDPASPERRAVESRGFHVAAELQRFPL